MSVTVVRVSATAGPVSVRVGERRHLQSIVAVVWRFGQATEREGAAGEIGPSSPEVPLGAPTSIAGKGFLVDGFVVPELDGTPRPYQVIVTVLQGGSEIHQAVPTDHGSGTVGLEEVRFRYPFVVRIA